MDNFEQFENDLKNFDWYYMMSDDHRVYNKGMEKMRDLQKQYQDTNAMSFNKQLIHE